MPISKFTGKAQTVLGPIDGKELGITLTHEHLIMDHVKANFVEPVTASDRAMAHKPVSLETLHWLSVHRSENTDNMQLSDEQEAIDEAMLFKDAGGITIVDVTNIGIARDPRALTRVSRATGLNIIMGAGHYLATSHPQDMSAKTEEDIADEIVRDVTIGVGDTEICAGIIGEIGCSWPLQDNERKALISAARAQQNTGAPINIHPGRKNNVATLQAIEILGNAGADLSRTVTSHVDLRVRDLSERRKVAQAGCYLEYDTFGWAGPVPLSIIRDPEIDIPSDTQRIHEIMQLIEDGYLNQILISHDICHKNSRARYGGIGYNHILNYIVPMMEIKGMPREQIDTILIENPKRILCFV
jgi:phosphotriesterase-related protein